MSKRVPVALKKIKIGTSYRMPGESVPEALGWKNLRSYLGSNILGWPDDPAVERRLGKSALAKVKAAPAPEPEPAPEEPKAETSEEPKEETSEEPKEKKKKSLFGKKSDD